MVTTPTITVGIYHPNYEFNPEKQRVLIEKLNNPKFLDDLNDLDGPHIAYEIRFEMDINRSGYRKKLKTSKIEWGGGKMRYEFKVYIDASDGEFLGGRYNWYDPWH